MEVTYKRYLNQSYMVITADGEATEEYEFEMMSYNHIAGLLLPKLELSDGKSRYWYDITGKQSLDDYLQRRGAGHEILRSLFYSLEKVCHEIAVHLLVEERLVLQTEYIYLDFACTNLELVYLPGRQENLKEEFRKIMEELLPKLDHSDRKAVSEGYCIYQLALQSELSLSEMLLKSYEEEIREEDEYAGTEPEKKQERKEAAEPEMKESQKMSAENRKRYWKREWLWITGWNRMKDKVKEMKKPWKSVKQEAAVTYEYVKEQEEAITPHPTEYLAADQETDGKLVYQGADGLPEFILDRSVFLIGNNSAEVDGCIPAKGVSRVHAKIEKDQDGDFVQDMNSTNGTFVNGVRLEYRQKRMLEPRDRIAFGSAEFIYIR